MSMLEKYATVGISPSMLYPQSFEDDLVHLHAMNSVCRMPQYKTLETFLPEDPGIRKLEIKLIRESGKILNYNSPMPLQQDGPKNTCSDDPSIREAGLAYAKMNVDFAAEAGSRLMVITSPPDKGDDKRPEMLKRFGEFYFKLGEYAEQYDMTLALEPIERHRFKKLMMGPTSECADFIRGLQKQGCKNAKLMLDISHLPLMEEDLKTAIELSMPVGISLVHMADAVLDSTNEFYGHTHPPLGVQGGIFDQKEYTEQFSLLLGCGYLPATPCEEKPLISLEVRPYPGVLPESSAVIMYEKVESAFKAALAGSR